MTGYIRERKIKSKSCRNISFNTCLDIVVFNYEISGLDTENEEASGTSLGKSFHEGGKFL